MDALGEVLNPLEAAIATRLKADGAINALVGGRIYNLVAPQGAQKPYLTLGAPTEVPSDLFMHAGVQVAVAIDIWTAEAGKKQALTLYGHCKRLLDLVPVAVTGTLGARGRMSLVTGVKDPDGVTTHLPARFEAWLQKAAA